jgi:peptidoglycan/xylan/chitin deacetylase (PgdA/CDA1 family)
MTFTCAPSLRRTASALSARIPLVLLLGGLFLAAGCKRNKPAPEELIEVSATPAAAVATPEPTPTPTPEPTPEPSPIVDKSARVTVLCYHRFEEKPKDGLALSPADFRAQLQALKDNGIEVISMDDFLAWRREEKSIPPRSAVITIDDGYNCSYHVAWPILKEFGYPFTMFVYTKYISAGGRSITWEQLEEMRDAGVDIGSHTASHQNLSSKKGKTAEQYAEWLEKELRGSKEELEHRLGIRVTTLAYPYGLSNDEVRQKGLDAGYEALFSVRGDKIGWDAPAAAIGRYAIQSTNPEVFKLATNFGHGGSDPAGGAAASVAAASMLTSPAEGEVISERKPMVKANLETFGEVDPATVEMRVSGFGLVPAKYDPATKTISYQFTQKIRQDSCSVIVSAVANGRKVQTRWSFYLKDDAGTQSAQAPGA